MEGTVGLDLRSYLYVRDGVCVYTNRAAPARAARASRKSRVPRPLAAVARRGASASGVVTSRVLV